MAVCTQSGPQSQRSAKVPACWQQWCTGKARAVCQPGVRAAGLTWAVAVCSRTVMMIMMINMALVILFSLKLFVITMCSSVLSAPKAAKEREQGLIPGNKARRMSDVDEDLPCSGMIMGGLAAGAA